MKTTTAPGALYWAETGDVCCRDHAPYQGSDTWVWGRWRLMTDADRAAMEAESGQPASCECCDAIARRRAEVGPCS